MAWWCTKEFVMKEISILKKLTIYWHLLSLHLYSFIRSLLRWQFFPEYNQLTRISRGCSSLLPVLMRYLWCCCCSVCHSKTFGRKRQWVWHLFTSSFLLPDLLINDPWRGCWDDSFLRVRDSSNSFLSFMWKLWGFSRNSSILRRIISFSLILIQVR